LTGPPAEQHQSQFHPLKIDMSALTVIFCIWAMVAFCAILFIRGATSRVERPGKAPQKRPARFSIAE